MVMAVVLARAVLVRVLVLMFMLMTVLMTVVVGMVVTVLRAMLVVMSAYTGRSFSGQTASTILTHYSISKEASSISRPARSSPLRL